MTAAVETRPLRPLPAAGPRTLAQKLVARACGEDVEPGRIVICQVDLAMSHDSSGPRRVGPMLDQLGAPIWDKRRYVVISDHYVPGDTAEARAILDFTRDWVRQQALPNFHDAEGICHVVLPQRGHVRPGMLVVGGDSHSPTAGAFGAYAFGVGATEMGGVLATGQIWLTVPRTRRYDWNGRLGKNVVAKDMMLFLCGRFGLDGGGYEAVEFGGSAVMAMSMQERMTLCNMSAEFGAQAGLVACDDTTIAWLERAGVEASALEHARDWVSDPDATFLEHHVFDAAALVPQVAAPHSPANVHPIDAVAGQAIDVAYIGACTGAKLDDLRSAAAVLRGRRVAPGVELLVAPASLQDQRDAEREGVMATLLEAGAQLLPSACGACAGYGNRLAENARVVSSTARNFKGRMGPASSRVWLASPATVAASAAAGVLADPRRHAGA